MTFPDYKRIAALGLLCAGLPFAQETNSPVHTAARSGFGSVSVPLDSWIYPALDRLAGLGYLPDRATNIGPITRAECSAHAEQAGRLVSDPAPPAIRQLIADLKTACADTAEKATGLRLESLYSRSSVIEGTPLRDSYHFGQSVFNDFGRPYDTGLNQLTGVSMYGAVGRAFAYYRGEYQHAPGRGAYPMAVQEFIARADGNPLQSPGATAPVDQFRALEAYAGVRLGFETVTFGKQAFWWGPGANSALHFSTNAEPFYSIRFSQTTPLVLPGPLARLGKIRTEVLFGKLSGHLWPPRPFINAQKISFDITENFELGFSRSSIFGGVGHPLTLGAVAASVVSVNSSGLGGKEPGDRHAGFDFRYRLPGLRRYVTVYSDSFADDDVSPLANPKRSAWAPGLYVSQIPGLRSMDFRFETYATWLYRQDEGGGFLYHNMDYHDSYTNNGYLLGSWVGRDARAYVVSSAYWFSGRSKVQGMYRQIKTGDRFLPGGGTQTDGTISAQWGLNQEWQIVTSVQYERYFVPVLGPERRTAIGTLQVVFTPQRLGF